MCEQYALKRTVHASSEPFSEEPRVVAEECGPVVNLTFVVVLDEAGACLLVDLVRAWGLVSSVDVDLVRARRHGESEVVDVEEELWG